MDAFVEAVRAEPDPDRRARLLCARLVTQRQPRLPWYDGTVNDTLVMARSYLAQTVPAALPRFAERLERLRVDPGFAITVRRGFLQPQAHADLQAALARLEPDAFQQNEIDLLGRFKLNRLAAFAPARACAKALVEECLGRPVRPTYTMFVRYFSSGRLPVHLDSFNSQYAVGICINRSASWPIHCSSIVPEPLDVDLASWTADAVLGDPGLTWTTLDPEPNQAFVFAPAHQWHWRDAIGVGHDQPYDMLYFSFVEPDAYDLLHPASWVEGFGIDELDQLVRVLVLAQ